MAKVLIISGDEGTRYLYEVAISYQKIGVYASGTLADGVKKVAAVKPDLIILDIMTPDMKNIDILKELKGKVGSLPLIIMTDMQKPDKNKEASILGACQYLIKGEHSLGDLIKTVRKVVKK